MHSHTLRGAYIRLRSSTTYSFSMQLMIRRDLAQETNTISYHSKSSPLDMMELPWQRTDLFVESCICSVHLQSRCTKPIHQGNAMLNAPAISSRASHAPEHHVVLLQASYFLRLAVLSSNTSHQVQRPVPVHLPRSHHLAHLVVAVHLSNYRQDAS